MDMPLVPDLAAELDGSGLKGGLAGAATAFAPREIKICPVEKMTAHQEKVSAKHA